MEKVVIVGAGASGIMAALELASVAEVIIIEKKEKIGKKLSITGKGRCNITFNGDFEYFNSHILENGKFMYSSFNLFSNEKLVEFVNKLGVRTKLERGNRIFLESDDASELVDSFKVELKKRKVKVMHNSKVENVEKMPDGRFKINIEGKESILADRCIIATGGKSYPATGSEGDGYKIAESFGHSVSEIRPGLVGIKLISPSLKDMQGLTLKNVKICVKEEKNVIYEEFGEMLFTHFGVSGPVVLSASSKLSRQKDLEDKFKNGKITFSIDLKPVLTSDMLDRRICSDFKKYNNKEFKNSLFDLLPKKIISEVIKASKIDEKRKVNEITKEERGRLVKTIKNVEYVVSGLMPVETGIVTVGGINLKQINPKTLESKIVPNLYFIGEILDLDAYTGGFNLQIAFSTGYACGHYIKESIQMKNM